MRKVSGLLALAVIALALSGCGAAGDAPAKKWIEFVNKHEQAVRNDSFDAEAFKSEGKPIAQELAKHKGDDDKVRLTQEVLDDFNSANENFGKACGEKGNFEALGAFVEVAAEFDSDAKDDAAE